MSAQGHDRGRAAPLLPSQARREILKRGALVAAVAACGLLSGARRALAAAEERAFGATSMREVLEALGGVPATGAQIVLTVDEVVENGAVVPVSVESALPGIEEIYIVVESNPVPLAVRFTIPPGTDAFVSTRVKMAQSGPVHAVVRAEGRLYSSVKDIQVTLGACS